MTQFAVDTDRLAKTEPEFRRIAADLEKARKSLAQALNSHGNCWGDDKVGKAFEGNYLAPAESLRTGLIDLVEVLTSVADGVKTMAAGADRAEQDAVETASVSRTTEAYGSIAAAPVIPRTEPLQTTATASRTTEAYGTLTAPHIPHTEPLQTTADPVEQGRLLRDALGGAG